MLVGSMFPSHRRHLFSYPLRQLGENFSADQITPTIASRQAPSMLVFFDLDMTILPSLNPANDL
jgi:hypothetical protein